MKRPPAEINEIAGENKHRDFLICIDYCKGKPIEHIISERKLKLTVRRIKQIVSRNAAFINPRIGWTLAQKKHYLLSQIELAPTSEKDPADLLKQICELEQDEQDKNNPFKNTGIGLVQIFQTVRVEEKAAVDKGSNQSAVLFGEEFIEKMRNRGAAAMN